MKTLTSLLVCFLIIGCTEQERAKNFGGTAIEQLPANRKLITVTWKDDHIWYLTRAMNATDVAEAYEFKEQSSWGLLNGTVVLQEVKTP